MSDGSPTPRGYTWKDPGVLARRPNILLLVTDQQRRPRHWPDEPGWLRELMPNDAELARTGLSFRNGFCNTAMCSPSRATLFTGRYPAEHGVKLTLTAADLRPDPRNMPAVLATMADLLRSEAVSRRRTLRQFGRGLLRLDSSSGGEAELDPTTPSLPRLLASAGLHRRLQGQVAPHPSERRQERRGAARRLDGRRRGAARARLRVRRLGGARRGREREGGELRRRQRRRRATAGTRSTSRQVERWLGRDELPEPFCLVVSLVNPHDVLGYPAQYEAGGYRAREFRQFGVGLPPTVDEDLRGKPGVHSLMRLGMAAYLGPLTSREAKLDYVNFYAYLHRVIDDQDRARACGARRPGRSGFAALADDDRALLRPRRDGPLPRRPAPEGVQRLRGVDQRARS